MHKAERTQADDLQEDYSIMSALDCGDSQDMTRQEFKDDADTNKLLNRFGVGLPQRQAEYGQEINFDLDLQTALDTMNKARLAYRELPAEIRKQYPSWQRIVAAINSGTLTLDIKPKDGIPDTQQPKPDSKTTVPATNPDREAGK